MRDPNKPAGNARMAAALVDVLGVADGARRVAVEQALGDPGALRRRRADWIRPELLRELFRAGGVDEREARRVGHALVSLRGLGLFLCHAGIATPEKAYRRADQLFAREQPGDRFEPGEIEQGRAHVHFHPKSSRPEDTIFCAVRKGMLEATTTVFGLLPASVEETECAHRGDERCTFEARWTRTRRTGLVAGGLCGAALGAGLFAGAGHALGAGWLSLGSIGLAGWALVGAVALGLLGAAVGRTVDLSRQLTGVAGGRLGQLALLDQMEGVFAEKMDALAKLDRLPDEAAAAGSERRPAVGADRSDEPAARGVAPDVLRRFNGAVAVVEDALSRLERDAANDRGELAVCDEAARELRAVGLALSQEAEAAGGEGEVADLGEIVRRGVAAVRPGQPPSLEIDLALEVDRAPVRCHAFQLEQVVIQLLMNAAEATGVEGRVAVALRPSPDGFELVVSDQGEGMDPEVLDGLFDPFFAPTAASAESGLGLTLCYRIVDRHAGELSVQSEPGHGTTVAVVLPTAEWDEACV